MRKIIYEGKEITTNLGESGARALVKGDDLPNYTMILAENYSETDEQLFARCARMGYTRIRLARVSTMIKGLHKSFAYCR